PPERQCSRHWQRASQHRREVAPGAVHLPVGSQSINNVSWSTPSPSGRPAGSDPRGCTSWRQRMSVRTVCLGWHWQPYRCTRTADDANGQRVLDFPDWLADFGRAALAEAYDSEAALAYRPDTALVNYYDDHARLGM